MLVRPLADGPQTDEGAEATRVPILNELSDDLDTVVTSPAPVPVKLA